MLDRKTPPHIKDAIQFKVDLAPCEKATLDNGIPLYFVNGGTEEVLMLDIVFFAGNDFEQQNLVANGTNNLIKNGTSLKNAFQINEHFEYYGAYLNRACHNETANITLHCLSKYLSHLLPVVQEVITDSVFPEAELETYKQNSKQQLSVNLKKCDFIANRLIDEYVYGEDHPYGKYSTMEAYDAVTAEQLREFFKKYYVNGKCIIFAAGKLPADFIEQINKAFGQLTTISQVDLIKHTAHPAEQKKYRIENDPNSVQGAIRLARPFPNRKHPDYKKTVVLNTVFGGFFGSRLMSNIREDKGYTYGIHTYMPNHIHQTAWMVSTEAGKDVCEATLSEIYKEMELLKTELIDEEELLLVKNYMIGSTLGDIDGPFHIINRWKNLVLHGLDESFFKSSVQSVKDVTAEELQELAIKYLNPDDFYELIVY
ncbi:pitrilysin family protein [soil metagenome]